MNATPRLWILELEEIDEGFHPPHSSFSALPFNSSLEAIKTGFGKSRMFLNQPSGYCRKVTMTVRAYSGSNKYRYRPMHIEIWHFDNQVNAVPADQDVSCIISWRELP